jgi:trk system potassium uptake protein TrkH
MDTNTAWSVFGKLVILFLIQAGGLGIMSLATLFSLLTGRQVSLKERLTIQESLNEFSLAGVVRTLKNILIATFLIELAGAALLCLSLVPLYGFPDGAGRAVFQSISAFCNAGFDVFGSEGNEFASLSAFTNDPVVLLTSSTLFIVGGLGFIVWKDMVTVRRFSGFLLHTKVVLITTFFLIAAGAVLIFLFEYNNPSTLQKLSLPSKVMNAFFHAVTPRTAGFNTISTADMSEPSKFVTIFLMFIGAAPGSTGGGVKVTTFSVIMASVISYVRGNDDINLLNKRISEGILKKSLSLVIISITIVSVSSMVLLINDEGSFMQTVFEATSAFGTVGLSTGITPGLATTSKLQIILTMFLGRIGPLSAALILTARHASRTLSYRLPEGKINVS